MPLKAETINITENLIHALDIEINTIGNNPFRITVKNGIKVSSTGSIFIYKFELDDITDVPDDTYFETTINRQRLKATIISSRGLEMMIAFETDNGNHINQITIEISNTNLLKSLKQLIEKVSNSSIQINEDIILKLFSHIQPLVTNDNNIFLPPLGFSLDDYQIKTIENTINSEISFIWGPPGTGKTIVIAILTKMFVESGLSVLVTSNTNIAVDNVFEKYIELFRDTSADLQNGKIIRVGNIQTDSIKEYVQESAIIQRIAAPLYQQIKLLNDQMKPLKEKHSHLLEQINDYQEYAQIKNRFQQQQRQLLKAKSELLNFEKILNDNQNSVKIFSTTISQLEEMLIIAQNTNLVMRLLKGIKSPQTIEKELKKKKYNLNNLILEVLKISNSINSKNKEIKLIQANLAGSEREINSIKQRVPDVESVDITDIQNQIKRTSLGISEIENRITELKKQIEDVGNNLLKEARVIGATLSMFHSRSILYSRKYDVVFIDEVTMAIQPQIFFAACFASKKVIVVGDFNQLQPIIRTKNNQLVKEWLKKDIFRKNEMTSPTDSRLNTLKIQRRMKKPIAEISNQTLYNGILEHQPINPQINDEPAVSFYDTANFEPYATIPPNGQGRINVYNAVLSIKLAQKYYPLGNINSIGIITPYRSQANLITKLIKDLDLLSKVSADTVHKFQGLEKDVIIFDITDGENAGGFRYKIGANLRDVEESPYLFNVAFTRARHKLIVIGDLKYLRSNINVLPNTVRQMIGKITLSNSGDYEIIDSMQIIDDLIYTDLGDGILQNFQQDSLKHFTEQFFYTDFFSEINNCSKSITIYSPFIAINRVTNNFNQPFFQNLINQNIIVKIITRPFGNHPNPEFARACIERWRNIGIPIETRQGMHEKIAILDKKVIYYGSLNILSQWQSRETMLKIVEPNAVNELLKLFS